MWSPKHFGIAKPFDFGDKPPQAEAILIEQNLMFAIHLNHGIVDTEVHMHHIRMLIRYPFLEVVECPETVTTVLRGAPNSSLSVKLLHYEGFPIRIESPIKTIFICS